MYLIKTPNFVKPFGKSFIWKIDTNQKALFLTFDDGPIPVVTPWVLDTLDQFDAKATFFCVGENAARHSDILQEIIERGHLVGNHTQNHLNGWKTNQFTYCKNIVQAKEYIQSNLFRPPYGKITPAQTQSIKTKFHIVMWDVLSGDFDREITPQKCYENVINNTEEGSVIVFHDSIKAWPNLEYTLPKVLCYYSEKGFEFKALSDQYFQKKP